MLGDHPEFDGIPPEGRQIMRDPGNASAGNVTVTTGRGARVGRAARPPPAARPPLTCLLHARPRRPLSACRASAWRQTREQLVG
jgi:hypothetical protein